MALTNRQQRFIDFYLQSWNATDAARRAGYKNANRLGSRLTKRADIREAIQARMKETQLKTDDVLSRLGEQATANYAEFFNFGENPDGTLFVDGINWEVFKSRGHLVKKLSYDRKGNPVIEFHDAQTALIQIGKALGILRENIEQTTHTEQVETHLYLPEKGTP